MFNKNLKKKVAVLLTGVMVLGMTVTASAAGNSGYAEGEGNFEGHVNRKVVDVTLPTVAEGTTPFNFIMDNEGLIEETTHKAYGNDFTFSDGTNVYFKTADKTFGKDSTVFSVSNNSSVSVNVTLKIDVTEGTNDPELVGAISDLPADYDPDPANPVSSGTPSLFLGLVVAGDATAAGDANGTYAISENSVSKTFNLNGKPDNYEVSVNQVGEGNYPHDYQFVKKSGNLTWDKIDFNLTGKANKVDDAEGITAPRLKVTWSFDGAGTDSVKDAYIMKSGTKAYIAKTQTEGFDSAVTKITDVDGNEFATSVWRYDSNSGWVELTWLPAAGTEIRIVTASNGSYKVIIP